MLNVANRAGSTLAVTIDSAVQALTVASGSLFPASNFIVTIEDERILVGTRTGNVFSSLTRGYGSTAASHDANARVELHIVAEVITELQAHVTALEEATTATRVAHCAHVHDVNYVSPDYYVIKRWSMADFYGVSYELVGVRVCVGKVADGEWKVLVTAHGIGVANKTYEVVIAASVNTGYLAIAEVLALAEYQSFDIGVCLSGDIGNDNPQDVDVEVVSYAA